jgi:hypothetical protein
VHPRSHQNHVSETGEETFEKVKAPLCRDYFFRNKCHGRQGGGKGKKSQACPHHYDEECENLAHFLKDVRKAKKDASIAASLDAAPSNGDGTMDMVYYIRIKCVGADKESSSSSSSIWEHVTKCLATRKCHCSNIVYVVINQELVYDRYRGGLVAPPPNSDSTLDENSDGRRRTRSDSKIGHDSDERNDIAGTIPSSLLEHILTFLPDTSVATVPLVCRGWNDIGKSSPNLWKLLLRRRQWLTTGPPKDTTATTAAKDNSAATYYRRTYTTHYTALRCGVGGGGVASL